MIKKWKSCIRQIPSLAFSDKFSIASSGETTDRIKKVRGCKNGTPSPKANRRGVFVFYADADHHHSNHVCHCHYTFNHRATGHHSEPTGIVPDYRSCLYESSVDENVNVCRFASSFDCFLVPHQMRAITRNASSLQEHWMLVIIFHHSSFIFPIDIT